MYNLILIFSETSDTGETNDTSENARKAAKKAALEAARGTSRETCKNVQRRAKEAASKYIHFPFMCLSSSLINLLFLISIPVSFAEPMPTFLHILRPLKLKLSQMSGIIIIHISIILIIILNNHNISPLTKLPSNIENTSFCLTGQLMLKSLKRAGVVNILFGFKTLAKTNGIQYIFKRLILQ